MWPDWNYAGSATHHQGQLGHDQTFTLAADPPLVATSPLVISAPGGYFVHAPVDESLTITNESATTLSVPKLFLAVRTPHGASKDQTFTIAPHSG